MHDLDTSRSLCLRIRGTFRPMVRNIYIYIDIIVSYHTSTTVSGCLATEGWYDLTTTNLRVYTAKKIQDQDPTVGPNSNNNTRTGTPLFRVNFEGCMVILAIYTSGGNPCEITLNGAQFLCIFAEHRKHQRHFFFDFSESSILSFWFLQNLHVKSSILSFWFRHHQSPCEICCFNASFRTISMWNLDQCHESRTTSSHGRCKGATPWRAAWNWPMLRCSAPLAGWGWLISWKIPSL